MSSTKIINVLKDDSFEEILGLFKNTSAQEVIFVLPKSARAFKKEEHFALLSDESKSLGKSVSFLSSNSDTNDIAKKYKFDVLLARAPVARKKASTSNAPRSTTGSIDVVNEIEDFYSEPATSADSISTASQEVEEIEDDLDNRRLDDIFIPEAENKHAVKVHGAREKNIPVEVNKDAFDYETIEHDALREIKSVWGSQPVRPKVARGLSLVGIFRPVGNLLARLKPKAVLNNDSTPRKSSRRRGLITLVSAAIIILGVVIFMTTGKAQVVIKPTSQPLDFSLTIFSADDISSVNLTSLQIPGQLFNIQKTVSQDFTATGRVDVAQKARGVITVYNELSSDQPLVSTTRFESADGHIFRTLTSIVVPAAKTVNGKLVPGSKDVQVIADKAGSEYNVPVGLFTIPAFKEQGLTDKYKKIYGQSTAPIRNGTSGQSTVVTDENLNTAKETLITQLTNSIKDELKNQINGLKIINDNQISIGTPVSTSPADASTTTFSVSLSGSLKTIGFKESDLHDLVIQYVDTQKNMVTLVDKFTITYENPRWDEAKQGLSFTAHVTGTGYSKIEKDKIIKDLLGKSDTDMRAYLGSITGVSSAHVSLSPFWVRSIPKSQDRVRVDLSY